MQEFPNQGSASWQNTLSDAIGQHNTNHDENTDSPKKGNSKYHAAD